MTEMWFMRHGETDWNVVRRLQGWRDIPLNETGRLQAQSLGEHLAKLASAAPFDVAYTSDLVRTVNTLAPAAKLLGMTPISEPGLRERHHGALEGLAVGELTEKAPPAAYDGSPARSDGHAASDVRHAEHGRCAATGRAAAPRGADRLTRQPATPCRSTRPRKPPGAGRYRCLRLQLAVEFRLREKSAGRAQDVVGTAKLAVLPL